MPLDEGTMHSFHETEHFTEVAVALFRRAQEIVSAIPDPETGAEPWRCHEVARVVGWSLGLEVVDGTYGHVSHSWLVVPGGGTSGCDAILDVYAAGVLPQVVLVDLYHALPARQNYKPGKPRDDVRHDDIERMERGLLVEEKS